MKLCVLDRICDCGVILYLVSISQSLHFQSLGLCVTEMIEAIINIWPSVCKGFKTNIKVKI